MLAEPEAPTFDRPALLAEVASHGIKLAADVAIGAYGNSAEMASNLGALIRNGPKVATASLLWEVESEGSVLPQVGEREIVVTWKGELIAVTENTRIDIVLFGEVGEEFAFLEGEGDRSLKHWRRVHWTFFESVCKQIGREPSETMPIVCQRFRRLYPSEIRATP